VDRKQPDVESIHFPLIFATMKFLHRLTEFHGVRYAIEEVLKAFQPDEAYFWCHAPGRASSTAAIFKKPRR
jgi:hypothetical protein